MQTGLDDAIPDPTPLDRAASPLHAESRTELASRAVAAVERKHSTTPAADRSATVALCARTVLFGKVHELGERDRLGVMRFDCRTSNPPAFQGLTGKARPALRDRVRCSC